MKHDGWCLRSPYSGELIARTFAETREGCWHLGYEVVANAEGDSWRNWSQGRPVQAVRSAYRRGWKIVPVRIVEVGR